MMEMREKQTHMNRLWQIAPVAVLLLVALSVMPAAAVEWPTSNGTFIPTANAPRVNIYGNGTYHFTMYNGTGGMNALHVTDSITNSFGDVHTAKPTTGTMYVSDTGGRGGQDEVLLLIAVNSTNSTDIDNFAVKVNVSGYQWTDLSGYPPSLDPEELTTYNSAYYKGSALNGTYNAANYLEYSSSDVFQRWKFAPLPSYPLFGGQDMSIDKSFKLLLIDTQVGTIGNRFTNYDQLEDNGMARIDYAITSNPSSSANITMNAYAYSNVSVGGGTEVNWLNRVNTSTDGPSSGSVYYSSWKITP